MNPKPVSKWTDQELLVEAKKQKSARIFYAFFIGFLIGIVLFSVMVNTFGWFMLIPLYVVYKLINDPQAKKAKEIEQEIQSRQLPV